MADNRSAFERMAFGKQLNQILNNARSEFSRGGVVGDLVRGGLNAASQDPFVQRLSPNAVQPYGNNQYTLSQGTDDYRDVGGANQQFLGTLLGDPLNLIPAIAPAMKLSGKATKALGKEVARQIETGTGIIGKNTIDPRMYMYNPKNPNLGSNFERIFMGETIPPKEFNFDDWLGASSVTHPVDRTNRDYIIDEVSGIKILPEFQFLTEGGIGFGEDAKLANKNIIMASTKNAMEGAYNRALKVQEQNRKLGGSGKVLVNPNIQAELGYNFSTMPTELVNAIVKSKGMTPKEVEPVDTMIRNTRIGDKKPYKDWVGLADSGALAQLQRGEGFSGNAPDLRKVVLDKATSVTGQKTIGFNEADLRLALTDPRLNNAQKHDLGLLWYEMDLTKPPMPSSLGSKHKTYNYDAFGTNVGTTDLKQTKDVYGDVYDNIYNTNTAVSKLTGKPLSESTRSQNAIHSLRDLHEGSSLYFDKKNIERLKKLFNR
jgi:hypothetical protein